MFNSLVHEWPKVAAHFATNLNSILDVFFFFFKMTN